MIQPDYLQKGDAIALVSPAGKVERDKVAAATGFLENLGLKVRMGKHTLDQYFKYASTDENRLGDFQQMLDDPEVKAIVCARGGYGTNRIIDKIDFTEFVKNPKWIIGFSDITVLHSHIHRHFSIETIHGSMAAGLQISTDFPETKDSLMHILFGKLPEYEWPLDVLSKKGSCHGILTGGNLAILCTLLGTPSDVDTRDRVLFIEEIGENLYRIDRMMLQLKRAGKLKHLAGLLVGGFSDIPDTKEEFGKGAYEIIAEAVQDYNYPVAFGFPAGHQPDNRALILGRVINLTVDEKNKLLFKP